MARISREKTFMYDGELWHVSGGGPGTPNADFGYGIWRDRDGASPETESFFRLSDVRDYIDECAANGWPLEG